MKPKAIHNFQSYIQISLVLILQCLTVKLSRNDKFTYKSYQTSVHCVASSPIVYPIDANELHAIIKFAIYFEKKVKVIGSRHSITDIICTDGIPISTKHLNYIRATSESPETVTVGSGAELKDVLEFLHKKGRTLIHVPAYGGITVGGAVGTGAHGSSLVHPNTLSGQVISLRVIDGFGELREINGTEDLKAFRVHLGLLGAIADFTLRTVPLFKMTIKNYVDSESILLDGTALKEARLHDWYQLWWFPSSGEVVVSKGHHTSVDTKGDARTNLIPDTSPAAIAMGCAIFEAIQLANLLPAAYIMEDITKYSLYKEINQKSPIFAETYKNETIFVNPATGYGHRLQSNRCSHKCAWDNGPNSIRPEESAMAFDIKELPHLISKIKWILKEMPAAFSLIGLPIRFSKASDSFMGIGAGRDSVHVEWTTQMRNDPYTHPRAQIGTYQAILQAMVHDHGGRPHWGKNGQSYFTREIIQKSRPPELLQSFQEAMQKFDPRGVFLNKFGRRVLLQSDELTVDPRVKRCALQDYCVCSQDSDCADLQVCGNVGKFRVCKGIIRNPVVNLPYLPVVPFLDRLHVITKLRYRHFS